MATELNPYVMNEYNNKLNELFNVWKAEILKIEANPRIHNGELVFTSDGILEKDDNSIDVEKQWKESPRRILFLLKDQPGKDSDDLRKWLINKKSNQELKSKFIHNIANAFYGLNTINRDCDCRFDELNFEEVKTHFNTQPFALVECKKFPGASHLPNKTLRYHLKTYGEFLSKEINDLEPNIIVCTSTLIYDFVIRMFNDKHKDDPVIAVDDTHNSIRIHPKTETIIFCSYHPSARFGYEKFYEGVMDHFRSGLLKSDYADSFKEMGL